VDEDVAAVAGGEFAKEGLRGSPPQPGHPDDVGGHDDATQPIDLEEEGLGIDDQRWSRTKEVTEERGAE
jgi:hypothetical protein